MGAVSIKETNTVNLKIQDNTRNKRQIEVFGNTLLLDEGIVQRYEHAVGIDSINKQLNGKFIEIALNKSPIYNEIKTGLLSINEIITETERVLKDLSDGYEEYERDVEKRYRDQF